MKLDAEEINGLQQAGAWAKAQWERLIQWRKTYSPTDLSGLDPDILAGFRRDLGRSPWNRVLQQPGVASSSGPRHQTESKASGEVDNTAATGDIDLLTTVWCWTIVVQDQMAPVYYFATLNVLERAEDRELLAHDMAHLEQKFPYLFKVCHALQPYDEPWRTALILFRERHVVMRLTSDKTSWQSNVPMVLGGVTEFPHTASGDSTNNIQSDKIVENGGTGERKSGDSQSQQQPKGFQLHDLHECSTQAEVQQHVWLCRVRWAWPPEAQKTGWAQAVKLEATAWPAAEYPAWQDPAVCVHVARYTPTQDLAHTLIRAWSREACEAALSPLPTAPERRFKRIARQEAFYQAIRILLQSVENPAALTLVLEPALQTPSLASLTALFPGRPPVFHRMAADVAVWPSELLMPVTLLPVAASATGTGARLTDKSARLRLLMDGTAATFSSALVALNQLGLLPDSLALSPATAAAFAATQAAAEEEPATHGLAAPATAAAKTAVKALHQAPSTVVAKFMTWLGSAAPQE